MTFVISSVALTVLALLLGFVVHAQILGAEYMKLSALFRAPEDHAGYWPYMIVAHVLFGIGFTWIYRQGRQGKPFLGQGVRFGLAVAVLTTIPTYLIYYSIQPLPGALVAKQIVFDTIGMVLMGIAAAWINQRDMGAS